MKRAPWAMGLLFMLGCADSFEPASLVDNLRPVAALVEVEDEPERANPNPGEVIRVTQHVIDAGPKPAIEWRFVACVPAFTVITPPVCGRLIEPCENCVNEDGPRAVDPVIRFQVPSQEELGSETEVVVQGAICQGDIASEQRLLELLAEGVEEPNPCANPKSAENPEGDEGRLISVRIPLEQYDPPNLQPVIASLQIGCNDQSTGCTVPDRWLDLPDSAPRTGCLKAIKELEPAERAVKCIPDTVGVANIRLSVTAESLQNFQIEDDGDTLTLQEEIQISWLADGGTFERSFSFINETSPTDGSSNPFESVNWALPPGALPEGTYVRFNFVIRDGRGGTTWEEHGLCVVPRDVWESDCL